MLVNHGKYNIDNSELGSIDRPMISASHLKPPASFPESFQKYKTIFWSSKYIAHEFEIEWRIWIISDPEAAPLKGDFSCYLRKTNQSPSNKDKVHF